MTNSTPIILDRLSSALEAQGVKLKRNQLLEVAASAFGHRNSNAFSAAAKAKEFSAPVADLLGIDDHGLTVLRDPLTGSIFAIDPKAPETRADQWCLSPYGGVIDVSRLKAGSRTSVTVHTATISHRHGTNFYVANTMVELDAQIAAYCDEYWSEACEQDEDLPETTEGMTDKEIYEQYFELVEDEYVEIGSDTLHTPVAVVKALETATGQAWVIARTNLDHDEPMLWWNDRDGWGDLASASVYPDTSGSLPMAGEEESVSWQALPSSYVTIDPEQEKPAEWMASPATPVHTRASALLRSNPIEAVPGVIFDTLLIEQMIDETGRPGSIRRTILATSRPFDHEIAREWAKEVKETLGRADAYIELANGSVRVIFKGDGDVLSAASETDWVRATTDLLQPIGERERIEAEFLPEVWIRDNAVRVDGDGPGSIDVTYEMLLIGREEALELTTGDTDYLKEAVRSPAWIREWTGPYTIRVHEAVQESSLFN